MRITNNMMTNNTVRNINAAANRLNEAEERVSTEMKISLPSDDPVVATRSIKYRNYVSSIEQYQKNVSDATSWQNVTDDALSSLSDIVTQVRTLTVKAASSTLTSSDEAAIKTEVSQLQQSVVDTMNTTYGGRYIFGGFSTSTAPYALDNIVDTVATTSGTNSYSSANISADSDVTAGSYNVSVAQSGGTYTYTLSDGTNNYTATSTSNTDPVAIKTGSGTVTLTAPTAGFTSGDAFSFNVESDTVVKFKGECLSTVTSAGLSDTEVSSAYSGNTYTTASAQSIKYNVGYNTDVTVNTEGQDVVGSSDSNLFNSMSKLLLALGGDTSYKSYDASTSTVSTGTISSISSVLTDLDTDINRITTAQAALGSKMTYVSTMSDRLASDYTTYTTLLSGNEDVDVSKATIDETSAQAVYDASLSVGAKAVSKTLVDYLA